ncbi:MAG: hypothetical protein JWM28_1003, partial [Chitinophagaceae bacterium]|nr:hypothetical protein [Chitinophagaceae bacterium]
KKAHFFFLTDMYALVEFIRKECLI